ncbi:hypothetical protein CKA32_006728 [Geitlerinema sp. FC II]|nr:hypothetical protein CKA32_006728 [Geitlerinema sp. FC II]
MIPKPHDLGSCFCPSRVFRNSSTGRNAFQVFVRSTGCNGVSHRQNSNLIGV